LGGVALAVIGLPLAPTGAGYAVARAIAPSSTSNATPSTVTVRTAHLANATGRRHRPGTDAVGLTVA
jgi:hypothetical protein